VTSRTRDDSAWRQRLRDLGLVGSLAVQTPLIEVRDGLPNGNVVWLKLEQHQPVRSFKIRGATLALSVRLDELRRRGVVADSGGNHSQALAYAGARLGVPVKIVMAAVVPETKKRATLGFGATDGSFELDASPADFVVAKQVATEVGRREGRHYLSPYDDEDVIRGAATLVPEILGQLEDAGAPAPWSLHVPIGGGGLISGLADANAELGHAVRIHGHEIEGADSAARSFHSSTPVAVPGELNPYAEGLAVRMMGERPHRRLREGKVDGVAVSTLAEVGEAYEWYVACVLPVLGTDPADPGAVWAALPEVSSMVAISGLLRYLRDSGIRDQTHVVVVTGGNTDRANARAAMEASGSG
jgi:threonine dehydratase